MHANDKHHANIGGIDSCDGKSRPDNLTSLSLHEISKGIQEIIVVLSQGDITKQHLIRWKYTLQDCEPFLKYHKRQILFRESVIALAHWAMGIKDKDMEQSYYLSQYCVACKKTGKADCKTCDKKVTISKEKKNG